MPLDPNRWTQKTQEAFSAAVEAAKASSNPEVTPDHLLAALLGQEEGVVLPILEKLGVSPLSLRNAAEERLAKLPKAYGGESRLGRELQQVLDAADAARQELTDEYLSTEHLLLALADKLGVSREELLAALARGAGQPPRHQPEPRGPVPGPREVRPGPHRGGAPGQARPGHRPRRGDPPHHPGAEPPHQEQPGAHRRARRRQDRHRRRAGPAHRRGRRARGPEEQAAHLPRPRRAWSPAPSTGASSRSGSRPC